VNFWKKATQVRISTFRRLLNITITVATIAGSGAAAGIVGGAWRVGIVLMALQTINQRRLRKIKQQLHDLDWTVRLMRHRLNSLDNRLSDVERDQLAQAHLEVRRIKTMKRINTPRNGIEISGHSKLN
jgi:uncharacterized protein (DUF1501 family)